jgi:hypothetical protein
VSSNRQRFCFAVPPFRLTFLHKSTVHNSGERGGCRNGAPIIAVFSPLLDVVPHANASRGRLLEETLCQTGKGLQMRLGDGEKVGCRESRIRHAFVAKTTPPLPGKTPVFSQTWGLSPPKSPKSTAAAQILSLLLTCSVFNSFKLILSFTDVGRQCAENALCFASSSRSISSISRFMLSQHDANNQQRVPSPSAYKLGQ